MLGNSQVSKTHKTKRNINDIFTKLARKIRSVHFKIFLICALIAIIPLGVIENVIEWCYYSSMIDNETALIQTEAAVIAGEFENVSMLEEAKKNGIYDQLVKYSTLNSIRIRVVTSEFLIDMDSYSIETGKTLLNSRVMSAYNDKKSISDKDMNNGAIEAVVPLIYEGNVYAMLVVNTDASEVRTFCNEVNDKASALIFGIIVLLIAVALLISRFFGKSYTEAFKVVEEVSNGHMEKRIEVKGYTELRDFARRFNDIMDKSTALDETRQEFVSNVSHELRTPITSIKVLADSLNMQDDVPIELYKEFMQDITKEIDRESKIIEDLLAIVRMDKSVAGLNITSVNVNELMEMVLTRLTPIAEKKNIEILFESFRPVVAEIDEVKFSQVISNLVDNAIKYNNIDGWVHVSLNADYQYFYIRVEDSGIGIPEEKQDMVFERFFRVDKDRSRETGGTGLGLAIVKKIILMHHGTVKLHSEEGVGTTFTVRIPLNYVNPDNK